MAAIDRYGMRNEDGLAGRVKGQDCDLCGKRGVLALGETLPRRANEVADLAEDNILWPVEIARKLKRKYGGSAEWLSGRRKKVTIQVRVIHSDLLKSTLFDWVLIESGSLRLQ